MCCSKVVTCLSFTTVKIYCLVHNAINGQKIGRISLAETEMAFHVLLGNTASKSLPASHLR